jgi:hypothetical protein
MDDLKEIGRAVETINRGVNGLEHRLRSALNTKVLDQSPDGHGAESGVKARQARNLANAARANLWRQPELRRAFFVLCDGFDLSRHLASEIVSALTEGWDQKRAI